MAALRILHMCPLLPVEAFRHIAGFRSIGGAYRRLEKLRRAGLAEMERAELGYLLAGRPLGLWSITEHGQRLFDEVSGADRRASDFRDPCTPARAEPNPTSLVAAYRLLAFFVAEATPMAERSNCARGNIRGFAPFVVLRKGIHYASSSQPVLCWRLERWVGNVPDRLGESASC